MRLPTWQRFTWWLYGYRRYAARKSEERRLDRDEPITWAHPILGNLTYSRELTWYITKRQWSGSEIDFSLQVETQNDPLLDHIADAAVAFWQNENHWLQTISDYAVSQMLESAQEWQWEKGPVSEADFRRRVKPTAIGFWSDDEFEVWFDDDQLFWGHDILINCSLSNGPELASIQG